MNTDHPQREPLDVLAEEFADRYRRGERPSLTEYVEKYPELADEIEQLLPAVALMEMAACQRERDCAEIPLAEEILPRELGPYRLLREVGRGGMGIVYEAEQIALGRRVALKVLPSSSLMGPRRRERFLREARSAARLHHTNIVPVFEIGEHQGVSFYAMQYIAGRGLDEVIAELRRQQGAPASEELFSLPSATEVGSGSGIDPYFRSAAQIGVQAADALAYAHRYGVLHRDIKPSNLLLDRDGSVWVTDFGLAKSDDSDDLTQTGELVGTLRYMAPERLAGQSDPRSDVYSLGLTLYELATLTPAFDESDRARLLTQVAHEEPALPRAACRRIPHDLQTIVLKAIAKEPSQRYRSADKLADDLRRFLNGEPIEARRTSLVERAWLWRRRNPLAAALGSLVLLLLVTVAIGASLAALKLHEERQVTLEHLDRAVDAERAALGAERLSKRRLYDALLAQARASHRSQRAGRRFEALEAIRSAAELIQPLRLGEAEVLQLRNEAIAALALADLQLTDQWPDHPPASAHLRVAFDADLERYAHLEPAGEVAIRRLSDNGELARFPAIGDVNDHRPYLQFSPDGRLLAILGTAAKDNSQTRVAVWDIGKRNRVLDVRGRGRWYDSALDFTPDGRRLAIGGEQGAIVQYDLSTAAELERFGSGKWPNCLRFDPAGGRLAVARDNEVEIVDAHSGKVLRQLDHPRYVPCVAWSAGGRLLAVACEDRQIYIWNAATGQQERVCAGHRADVRQVTFNHRGDLLASSAWDSTTRLWDPLTGRQLLSSTGCPIRFSRDDQWLGLGLAGAQIGRWKVAAGRQCRTIQAHGETRQVAVALSPDGRFLATASLDGARLWDCSTGEELQTLSSDVLYSVLFGPAGDALYLGGTAGVEQYSFSAENHPPRLGAARRLFQRPVFGMTIAQDGSTLAASLRNAHEAVVLPLDRPHEALSLKPHAGMRYITSSPDGRWVATGPWNTAGVCIWDAHSGRLERKLSAPRTASVRFSPDGRWLVISTYGECRFVSVVDWQDVWSAATNAGYLGGVNFTSDGGLAAVAISAQATRLLDVSARRELARFESPQDETMCQLSLSADGSRLAVGTTQGTAIVWDLRQIRADLAELGLE